MQQERETYRKDRLAYRMRILRSSAALLWKENIGDYTRQISEQALIKILEARRTWTEPEDQIVLQSFLKQAELDHISETNFKHAAHAADIPANPPDIQGKINPIPEKINHLIELLEKRSQFERSGSKAGKRLADRICDLSQSLRDCFRIVRRMFHPEHIEEKSGYSARSLEHPSHRLRPGNSGFHYFQGKKADRLPP